jgi:catechol 2,3-dioxygenase-like lactoylglutathione lyase family enzyme
MPRISGVNHVVVPTSDMQRTLDFYTDVLGLELAATVGTGDASQVMVPGQQVPVGGDWKRIYFFDLGGGSMLGFLEFPGLDTTPDPSYFQELWPGGRESGPAGQKMDHLAFNVESLDDLLYFQRRLREHGYGASDVNAYEASPFVKSVYFYDPNGLSLEIATYDRADTRWEARTPEMLFADPEPLTHATVP